ncbi:meiotic recombination protein REC8 homolog [Caloenas nicobarica]|uniref:meiotic recombination protein REC8 homolog n=1 Tax=Caloenas nicobarica TaxID=187106 RepID=UPI0032B84858
MFYYPEVLHRRTGCFGTIWLAATCSSRLLPREYLGVDVPRTCAAVTAFVIGRSGWEAPPPPAGAPPPRCSLYLAALLQLGLVRVLLRQCHRLLDDAAQTLERLHRVRPMETHIDVSPPRRRHLRPDARALMAALEWAPDPLFGVMGPGLPSPTAIPQLRRLLEEPLPPPGELTPPTLAAPEAITLREAPPAAPLPPEEELPEVTPRELELLVEAEELLPYVEEIPELPAPPPALRPPEEAPPPPPEVGCGATCGAGGLWGRTHRAAPPHSCPPSAAFQAQLLRPRGHCGALVLVEPPPKRRRPPSELLRTPACGWLPPELWDLWGRCARPAPRRPPAPPELPSEVEILREALEPSLPGLIPTSEISLELPEEELRPLPPEEPRPPPPLPPPPLPELPEAPEPEMPPGPAPNMAALRRSVTPGDPPGRLGPLGHSWVPPEVLGPLGHSWVLWGTPGSPPNS